MSPTKTVEPIKVPFGHGLGWAKEPRIRLERGYPEGKVQFWGLLWPIVKNREYPVLVSVSVGAFLQATSRVPRWWIGERPPDMAASCDIYK